jgi:16S rRNA G966 N2-methylase RsmD
MQLVRQKGNSRSLLSLVNWRGEGLRAAKELTNREIHAPAVSAFRWWARRPHNVMGALLDAAAARYGKNLTVSDPFSGGGTVTFEAVRRGLKAYAQDLYPWPARGLAAALSACHASELQAGIDEVLALLLPLRESYKNPDGAELSHILRVRVSQCLGCTGSVYEFPNALVSLASRSQKSKDAYFGCRRCGHLTVRNRTVGSFTCGGCGVRCFVDRLTQGCPHCRHTGLKPERWHAVLVQELKLVRSQLKAVLRIPREGDPVNQNPKGVSPIVLPAIPAGKETKRLRENGFVHWHELYTHRQAEVLQRGIEAIAQLDCDAAVRDRLAFSLLGAAEMPAFLSRWDRFNLKPFEGMANHRYTTTTLAVESNLLSPVGRGTLPRRFKAAATVLDWLIDSRATPPKVVGTTSCRRGRKRTDWDVLISTGSSVNQDLRDASVSVVITDPPYFDDVQYGELARLFHAWLAVYDPSIVVDEHAEAVPNSIRGTSADDYRRNIAACLRESRRTLMEDGRLVLTFHNKSLVAWRALCGAIADAGFQVSALAAVLAENSADHCKRTVNAMLHDLVIECEPAARRSDDVPFMAFKPKTLAEKNLLAVGLAMAECVRSGDPDSLKASYLEHLTVLGASKRLIE